MKAEKIAKMFPYVRFAKKITPKQKETVNSGTDKARISLYNKVFGADIPYCECPTIWEDIKEKLVITIIYQENV